MRRVMMALAGVVILLPQGCVEEDDLMVRTVAVQVVTVSGDDQVPIDLDGSQQLNIRNVTQLECDDMGGRFTNEVCEDVDY
jgi:hypothetical protein